jgi:hypothetical protein
MRRRAISIFRTCNLKFSRNVSESARVIYSPTTLSWGLAAFSNFLILYTVDMTPWTGYQPVTKPLPTLRTTQTQNKRTETSMPWVGFEPTISAFERDETVHAVDRAATGTSISSYYPWDLDASRYSKSFLCPFDIHQSGYDTNVSQLDEEICIMAIRCSVTFPVNYN